MKRKKKAVQWTPFRVKYVQQKAVVDLWSWLDSQWYLTVGFHVTAKCFRFCFY